LELNGRLRDRVAVITGGGRGIGRASALAFAQAGARVWICGRSQEPLAETVAAIRAAGGSAEFRVVDLGYPKKAAAFGQHVLKREGRVDILVNNAAVLGPKAFIVDYPFEQWEEVMRVNLTGAFVLTQVVARAMQARKSGCILSITSSVGRRGRASWGAYAASKAGVESLTQTLADELRAYNVRVLALNPGGTRTAMRAAAYPDEDPATLQPPEAVAGVLVDLALREDMALSGRSFDLKQIRAEGIHP
jgi:NAD(P)-dependent dehydrogenase (short-subunit alcohol dehydrogenase family)